MGGSKSIGRKDSPQCGLSCAKCLQPNTVWLAKKLKAHGEIQAKLTTISVSTVQRLLSPNRRVANLIAHSKRPPQASYDQPWLYHNFYQPVIRLYEKHLDTGAIKHIYDSTQTPLDRLCHAESLTTLKQVQLLALPCSFNPLQPRQDIQDLIDQILQCLVHPRKVLPRTSSSPYSHKRLPFLGNIFFWLDTPMISKGKRLYVVGKTAH